MVSCFAGALTLASVLLYPKTLGGGAVFSGFVPFNPSVLDQVSPDAKRVLYLDLGNFDFIYFSFSLLHSATYLTCVLDREISFII